MGQGYMAEVATATEETSPDLEVMENLQAQIWAGIEEEVRELVRRLVEQALEDEVQGLVGVGPYQRSPERRGYRNGSYRRELRSRYGPLEDIRVPRVLLTEGRAPAYQTFDRWERRTPDLERMIGHLFVRGISTRRLRSICNELWGAPVSASTVSRVTQALDYDVDAFLSRELEDDIEYLYLDGVTAKVRELGLSGRILLVALGVHSDGRKKVLGFRLSASESAEAWEGLLTDLKRRGLTGNSLRLVITDGGTGVIKAVQQIYPQRPRQRCLVHVSRNVLAKVRVRNKGPLAVSLRAIWEAPNRQAAARAFARFKARWSVDEERAVRCLEGVLDDCLVFYQEPPEFWRSVRTTNPIERAFREVRRRTKVMDNILPNDAAVLRIFAAVAEDMNRTWRGAALQPISTTPGT